jgi:hypothetical protein
VKIDFRKLDVDGMILIKCVWKEYVGIV